MHVPLIMSHSVSKQ